MDSIDINGSIQVKLNARFTQLLRSGDFVYISVIKKLAQDKWAVGIFGKIFPARTQIELKIGDVIKARVQIQKNTIYLKLISEDKMFLNEKLSQYGISSDRLSLLIFSSMINAGLPIDSNALRKIKQLLESLKKEEQGVVSLLVRILKKGISLDSPRIYELVDILNYGEEKRKKKEKQKKQEFNFNPTKVKEAIRDYIIRCDDNLDNILPLFNHLKAEEENWIIIPFSFTIEQVDLKGTIRMLYDSYNKDVVKMVVIVWVNQEVKWSFYLKNTNKLPTLTIFCNDEKIIKRARAVLSQLRLKLHNNNIKVDDIIHGDKNFDGFSLLDEINYYQSINTFK
jgi:hypothetical protein